MKHTYKLILLSFFSSTIITSTHAASDGIKALAIGTFAGAAYTYAVRHEKTDPTSQQSQDISNFNNQLWNLDYWQQPVQVIGPVQKIDVYTRQLVTVMEERTEYRTVLRSPQERTANEGQRQTLLRQLGALENTIAAAHNPKVKIDRFIDFFTTMIPISIAARLAFAANAFSPELLFGYVIGGAGLVTLTEYCSSSTPPVYSSADTVFLRAVRRTGSVLFGAALGGIASQLFFNGDRSNYRYSSYRYSYRY